jgi:hypothetical protein
MKIQCFCGQPIEVNDDANGQTFNCPSCETQLTVPKISSNSKQHSMKDKIPIIILSMFILGLLGLIPLGIDGYNRQSQIILPGQIWYNNVGDVENLHNGDYNNIITPVSVRGQLLDDLHRPTPFTYAKRPEYRVKILELSDDAEYVKYIDTHMSYNADNATSSTRDEFLRHYSFDPLAQLVPDGKSPIGYYPNNTRKQIGGKWTTNEKNPFNKQIVVTIYNIRGTWISFTSNLEDVDYFDRNGMESLTEDVFDRLYPVYAGK